MARTVTFNGITLVHPGGATKVDVTQLAQTTVLPTGILGLVGEADGGVPNQVSATGDSNEDVPRIYVFDDPATAKETFRSGPLADAIGLAFDAANDPRINRGVNRVYAIKTNQSTRSTVTLQDEDTSSVDVIQLDSRDYGAHTTGITFEIVVSSSDDNYNQMDITIEDTNGTTQDITEVGGSPLIELQYTGPDTPTILSSHPVSSTANAVNTDVLVSTDITGDIDIINDGNWIVITEAPSAEQYLLNQVRRVVSTAFAAGDTTIGIDTAFLDDGDNPVLIDGSSGSYSLSVLSEVIGPFPVAAISTGTVANDTITIEATPQLDQSGEPLVITTDAAGAAMYASNTNGPNFIRVISGPGEGQIREIEASSLVSGDLQLRIAAVDSIGFSPALTTSSQIMFVNLSKSASATDTGGALAAVAGATGRATSLSVSLRPGFGEKNSATTVVAAGAANAADVLDKTWNLEDSDNNAYSVQQIVNWINNGSNTTAAAVLQFSFEFAPGELKVVVPVVPVE